VLVLLLPNDDFQTGNLKISAFSRFWALFQPHRTVMVQSLVGAIAYTILGLGVSVYIQKITDYVWVGGNKNLLNLLSIGMIILLVLQTLVGSIKSMFALKTGQLIDAQLILGYYKYLLKLPQQFFDTMRVGEITSRINDAVKIRVFINDVALNLVVDVFIILFSFGLMFTYYWKLTLLMLLIIPIYVVLYIVSNRINKKQLRNLMEQSADLEAQLVESLNTMPTIKRFGLEAYANLKTETRFVALLRSVFESGKAGLYISNAMSLATNVFTIVLLWVGSYYVIDRDLTPGELMSFYLLIGYFTSPASGLIGMNRSIQDALIAADRLFEIMDLEREETENKVTLSPEMLGDIHFKGVSFRYGARVQVFQNLNLHIPRGMVTAFVGESGSGKSTLMALLQNMYPLQSGSISIGNFDIKHIDTESLRRLT
jgi:ATP-binding cassette, subfamily C, bacteriocin exporter